LPLLFMEKQHAKADGIKHPTARVLFLCPLVCGREVCSNRINPNAAEVLYGLISGRY
jgi:hypothetical protein